MLFRSHYRVVKISGYERVPASENDLLRAVAHQPVSVGIAAGGLDFQFYSSGVFNGDCGTIRNHAVTVVGYGKTSDGIKYWLVKNSYGKAWGENGYMRIQRGTGMRGGHCQIAMDAEQLCRVFDDARNSLVDFYLPVQSIASK